MALLKHSVRLSPNNYIWHLSTFPSKKISSPKADAQGNIDDCLLVEQYNHHSF